MGFLKSLGVRNQASALKPFMRSDEHFLETDVAELPVIAYHDDGRRDAWGEVIVSFTSHAVYIRPTRGDGTTLRIPHERITNLVAARGLTEIVTQTASYLIRDIGTPYVADKLATINAGIKRIENHRQVVDVPGGKVIAIHRPLDEGQAGQWIFHMTDGVDFRDASVRTALRNDLAVAFSRLGVPPALSESE